MVKIAFTGDIMLARGVGKQIETTPQNDIISRDITKFLENFDYVVGNLECPVSSYANKVGITSFKARPEHLTQLDKFHFLTVANNHIFDCGKQGAEDTIDILERSGKTFGGLLREDNMPIASLVNISDTTFNFFSCAVQYCVKDNNKESYPKIVSAEDPILKESIGRSSREYNYTIVIVHGGNEMIPYPEVSFRSLCESYIDAGADIVITHHPHVLGGIHQYKNKSIFYSLGDFIFDGESYIRRRGMILSITFDEGKINYNIHPTQIGKDLKVGFASKEIGKRIIRNFKEVSEILQNENKYKSQYKFRYVKSLIYFQADRFWFLLQNKGIFYLINFIFRKMKFVPFYFKKVFKK